MIKISLFSSNSNFFNTKTIWINFWTFSFIYVHIISLLWNHLHEWIGNFTWFSNILDEWKSQKLNKLFNFKFITHLGFRYFGNIGLISLLYHLTPKIPCTFLTKVCGF
jgi:hypothetical protein